MSPSIPIRDADDVQLLKLASQYGLQWISTLTHQRFGGNIPSAIRTQLVIDLRNLGIKSISAIPTNYPTVVQVSNIEIQMPKGKARRIIDATFIELIKGRQWRIDTPFMAPLAIQCMDKHQYVSYRHDFGTYGRSFRANNPAKAFAKAVRHWWTK